MRVEEAIKNYLRGETEYSTPSYVIGQILSQLTHNGLNIKECHRIVNRIRKEIEADTLYPSIPKEEKLRRLELLEAKLREKTWWYIEDP